MNKSIVRVKRPGEKDYDSQWWMSQPPLARLEQLETIREEYNLWKYATKQRFQRVYRVIKQK